MEHIWIWVVVGLLLWQGMTLLQFLVFLYYKFRFPEYHLCQKDEIDEQVQKILLPYEMHLLENHFVFKYAVKYKSMVVGSDLLIYKMYYYNPTEGVHAILETTPYKGSLQPVKLAYDTVYESKKICTTENGMRHYIPVVPKEIYFFDHYLPSWENIFKAHLKDRMIDDEKIIRQPFDEEGWLAYMEYNEHLYTDSNVEYGIAVKTEDGYRYRASLALWNFAKETTRGYKKFSKILKTAITQTSTQKSTQSHTQGLIAQMEQVDKTRGDSSSKMRWFALSVIAFVALFSLLGLSVADILILVIVLFVHELGHFLAMRYFGYTDTNIFFLPFGAITTGHKAKRKAYEEFIVSLMGPLPGLLIGIGIILYEFVAYNHFSGEPYLGMYALMSLIINYINLLPIYPLDGGRILQTLLLLRYPKGQFYFYIVGLSILVLAMVWMRDPLLLIFVVAVALGLKQSYRMANLLEKLFKQYNQEEITKDKIALLLTKDETFSKENLAFKARIAKQAWMIIETIKPSKMLMIFGLGFYMLLLTPPLAIGYFGLNAFNKSGYAKLTNKQKEDVNHFYTTLNQLETLKGTQGQNINMHKAMQRLDRYFKEHNITQARPFDGVFSTSVYPCALPKALKEVYHWHNGVKYLLGSENLYSVKQMQENYTQTIKEYPDLEKEWIPVTTDDRQRGIALECGHKGLYRYINEEETQKAYYGVAHLLQVSADAFEEGAYYLFEDEMYVDYPKLKQIKKRYFAKKDKENYEKLLAYLEKQSKKYYESNNVYFKRILVWQMQSLGDTQLIPALELFLNDKNNEISQIAQSAIDRIKKVNHSFPIKSVNVKLP